jgi:hypothetical protein
MKILKNIAIGLCMLFTIYSLGGQFLVWSGISNFLSAPFRDMTNGEILLTIAILIVASFAIGFDAARAKYEAKLRKVEGRDY